MRLAVVKGWTVQMGLEAVKIGNSKWNWKSLLDRRCRCDWRWLRMMTADATGGD